MQTVQTTHHQKTMTPARYINREISSFAFQLRVLAQAVDDEHPLLEQMQFLSIFSSNLDEFFEIRIAGLINAKEAGDLPLSPDGARPSEVLAQLSAQIHEAVAYQYQILNQKILPNLAKHGIRYLKRDELSPEQSAWMRGYFYEQVLPVLTPISIDPAHPFPRLVNKSLNFLVRLNGKDAFGRDLAWAVVPAPRSLPRVIALPDELCDGQNHHVMLSAVIHEHIGALFLGARVVGCHQFRLTRNADLALDDDIDDLAEAVKGKLLGRKFGKKVRLEVSDNCPQEMYAYLLNQFELDESALYRVSGPVNLTRFLTDFARPALRYASLPRVYPSAFGKKRSMFSVIAKKDVLVHHPFESFSAVTDFLWQAANDPDVLAIKQTIYRTGSQSNIVRALATAAKNGKEVTAVVEVTARFDEASNIALAHTLQEAGVLVVYGVVGYKTHAKMMLIVRREKGQIRRYAHLGTGNYHEGNARAYTDYGLFTAHAGICQDVHTVFCQLTAMGQGQPLGYLLAAPFGLRDGIVAHIEREISHAKAGQDAHIIFKVNALTEPSIIEKLYEASNAGVRVDLVVRSICCLRPCVENLSQNIRVVSIVGRFLEHTRVYYFANKNAPLLYLASADLMDRNLKKRVEVAFPIIDSAIRTQIIDDLFAYVEDSSAWELGADGVWTQIDTQGADDEIGAQQRLVQKFMY